MFDVNDKILARIRIIIHNFIKRKMMFAIAESCTGGYISHMITNISGASKVFERGIVVYSNKAKIELLNVKLESIEKYGAVSEIVVTELAENIRKQAKVDIGIAITGIAGPTGGTPKKPLGLVYIGFSTENEIDVKEFIFETDRINFKKKVLKEIISFLENIN